jgi:hypothetical protein
LLWWAVLRGSFAGHYVDDEALHISERGAGEGGAVGAVIGAFTAGPLGFAVGTVLGATIGSPPKRSLLCERR